MIECLFYNTTSEQRELFMISELSTLELTGLLDGSIKIQEIQVLSYAGKEYLEEDTLCGFDTIESFNRFFINNPQFYIHDCKLQLANGLIISSHDDGEVHIEQAKDFEERKLIKDLFKCKGLPDMLLAEVISRPGCYCSLSREGKIVGIHKTFDDYINGTV